MVHCFCKLAIIHYICVQIILKRKDEGFKSTKSSPRREEKNQ